MPIESVMPSSHLILCRPLLLLPPTPLSIRVFSNESALHMSWPKYWSFSFSISPSSEHPGLISFRMGWLDILAVQGTLKSLLQHHSSKASILWHSAFFTVQLSHPYMTTGNSIKSYYKKKKKEQLIITTVRNRFRERGPAGEPGPWAFSAEGFWGMTHGSYLSTLSLLPLAPIPEPFSFHPRTYLLTKPVPVLASLGRRDSVTVWNRGQQAVLWGPLGPDAASVPLSLPLCVPSSGAEAARSDRPSGVLPSGVWQATYHQNQSPVGKPRPPLGPGIPPLLWWPLILIWSSERLSPMSGLTQT